MIRGVNLLPAVRQSARQCRRYRVRWSAGFALYAAAMVGAWLVSHQLSAGPEQAMADQIHAVRRQIAEAEQTIEEVMPRLAQAKRTLAANRSVSSQPDWSLLLDLLADLLGEDTVLRGCELTPWTAAGAPASAPSQALDAQVYRLRITGLGQSQSSVSAYVLRLEQTGLFEQVKLISTQAEPYRDTRLVGFQIECQLGRPQRGTR